MDNKKLVNKYKPKDSKLAPSGYSWAYGHIEKNETEKDGYDIIIKQGKHQYTLWHEDLKKAKAILNRETRKLNYEPDLQGLWTKKK